MTESALGRRLFVEFVSVISKNHAAGSSNVENTLVWVIFWSKWIAKPQLMTLKSAGQCHSNWHARFEPVLTGLLTVQYLSVYLALARKTKSARASWGRSIRLCILPTTQRAQQKRREGSLEKRQLAVCFSVLLVWFEYLLYVHQGRCCHLSLAHIVNTKLGNYAASNTTKNTSKVLTLPRKGKRYDTYTKYILNQACQV